MAHTLLTGYNAKEPRDKWRAYSAKRLADADVRFYMINLQSKLGSILTQREREPDQFQSRAAQVGH